MRRRSALAVAGLALVLAGCSGAEEAPTTSPAERLAAAKAAFDAAGTVALDLTSRDVPPRENGVTAAKGSGVIDATEPKFQGTITGTIEGVAGTVDLICIGETAYMKFFTPGYVETDLATLDAPNPALFFDPVKGISSLLTEATATTDAGQTRAGREVLDKVDGTLAGQRVEDLFHLGDGTGTFTVSFGLTAQGQLRTASLKGPFFPGTTATYVLTLSDYGKPVEVTRP
ncbi:LppX_LprAFG lipoprotein [Oryzobacter terrae]|uniref:LppX_LprAFG lipoprotein n=1 Tax=Oryzobacter terrae TaxID=1620385 RepID=UPI00367243F7